MKRMLQTASVLALFALASPALAAEKYTFDKEHTNIVFSVNHLGFSNTMGRFTNYDGEFFFDEKNPEKSSVNITLKPAGIVTQSSELDKHLQAEGFFNSEKFPEIQFVSKSVKKTGKNTGTITGDLTLLGVTKPVTLNVTFNKADYHPMNNKYVAGFSADGVIKRSAFGMDKYVPMVGDDVKLHVEVEGVNEERVKPATEKH